MRISSTPGKTERSPEEQSEVEKGQFYRHLMTNFVQSFPMDTQKTAEAVFRQMESEYKGWSPEIEESARAMVEKVAAEVTTSSIAVKVNNNVKPVMQTGSTVKGNEAEEISELSGYFNDGGDRNFMELSLSARVADQAMDETPPPATFEAISEERLDMSLEAMARRLNEAVGEKEAKEMMAAAIERAGSIQNVYSRGTRSNG